MHIVGRVAAEPESPIGAAYALTARRGGRRPLLDLGQAAPPWPPPPVVVDQIVATARDPRGAAYVGQAGLPGLREAFAADLLAGYGGHVGPEHVVITAGANQAFTLVLGALAEPGDDVVVALPAYFNYAMWLRMSGIAPRWLEPGPDLLPDPDGAEALIGPRTRAIVLVSPGNPTGVTIPPATLSAFAALARRRGILLLLDETYRSFRGTDAPAHDLFTDPDWADVLVGLHSFSKDLAIPGYRVGALVAAPALGREVLKLLDCVAIGAPRVGQEAARAGLVGAGEWRAQRAAEVATRHAAFAAAMAGRPGGFELVGGGGFFGWVRHPFGSRPTSEVVADLVIDQDLVVIPGTAALPDDRGMLRFSVAGLDGPGLADLLDRLDDAGTGR